MAGIDTSMISAPPGKRRAAVRKPPEPEKSPLDTRIEGLQSLGQAGQFLLLGFGQWADAATVGQHWPGFSKEVADLADKYEIVAKYVDPLSKVGPLTGLLVTALPFFMQIAANHNWLNAGRLAGMPGANIVPKELLEAQMQMQIAQMQREAMEAQRKTREALQKLQSEMENEAKETAGATA